MNPYDVDETAGATPHGHRDGSRGAARAHGSYAIRKREHNIYRWAGSLLNELTRIPTEAAGTKAF